MTNTPPSPPPGWFPDPSGQPCLRYWDGQQFTSATTHAAEAAPPVGLPAPAAPWGLGKKLAVICTAVGTALAISVGGALLSIGHDKSVAARTSATSRTQTGGGILPAPAATSPKVVTDDGPDLGPDGFAYDESDYLVGYRLGALTGVPSEPPKPGFQRTVASICRIFLDGLAENGRQADPLQFLAGCHAAYRTIGLDDIDVPF